MKLRLSIAVALTACVLALVPTHVRTEGPRNARRLDYVNGLAVADGEVLVRLRTGSPAERAAIDALIDADDDHPIGIGVWRRIHSASRSVHLLLAALRGRGEILDIEPNYIYQATDTIPNDPFLPWGMLNTSHPGADIHATKAWDISTGSAANVVGVVDTGVDYNHPDLAANMWSAPSQFTVTIQGTQVTCPAGSHGFNAIAFAAHNTSAICDPMDDAGHGTHTAGTIGAVGNNGVGVVGVNWTTRIMALKFLDASGSGSTADAVNAIDFALQAKAATFSSGSAPNVRVLSNSWGGSGASSSLSQAITRAANADVLFVAAAGNSASNNDVGPFYPASFSQDNIVAVAATTETDGLASFSNYGPKSVDLGAPGNNILSTISGGSYGAMSGTSMATPHVSGAAMLVLSQCALDTAGVKAALLSHVDLDPALNGLVVSNGRLNVDAAIRSCASPPTVSLTSPAEGAVYFVPATIPLAANASDNDGIAKVEFYQGSQLIGTSVTAPYSGSWINVPAGSYTLTAKAYDTKGATTLSAPVHVTVSTGSTGGASATFAGVDSTTQGSWRGSYGTQGYTVVGDSSSWPAWATVTPAGQAQYQFAASTSDVRGLQQASGASRVAYVWYGDSWTLDVNVTDGQTHQLGLYLVDWDTTTRAQRMEVRDAASGALLDTQNASGYNGGQYWRWRITGHVTITLIKTAGWNAVVSGVFLDALGGTPPTVSLTAPTNGATYTAPASIALAANATDSDGVAKVEFYETPAQGQPTLIGQAVTTAPYQITWSNAPAGSYTLTAKAYDTLGATATSAPVQVTVSAGSSGSTTTATFAGVDSTTQGSWRGSYGAQGYTVVGDSASWPAWATVTPAGQAQYQFAASTSDVRGLQQATGASRVAYVWYGDSWTLDVNVTDGQTHQLGLYLVDWDTTTRAQRMEVRDAVSGTLLDTQNASGYNGGQYWRWRITGHVKITLIKTAGWNAVVSGVFLDSAGTPPTVSLTAPANGASYTAPASIALAANATDSDGVAKVEFYETPAQGQPTLIGQAVTTAPYQITWSGVPAGTYTLTAKAYDTLGAVATSSPVQVTVSGAGGGATATFTGVDATTQGNWRGVYGALAYTVVGDSASWPAWATVTPAGQALYQFASSTSDVRGLQQAAGASRVAYVWYADSWTLDVNLTDGQAHQLSLYLVDWDTTTRAQRMEVRDAVTGALLDTQNASGYNGGQYWRWTVSGHVKITLIKTAGWNAVVSGVFVN